MPGHTERRHLPYTPQQLFDLVADVEKYPEFLPGLAASRICRQEGNTVWVEMTIGWNLIRKRFSSIAVLDRPTRIHITSQDPLFDRFEQTWNFLPAAHGGAIVDYSVEFKFRSRLLQAIMGAFFDETTKDMIGAFKRRARQVYGPGRPAENS